MTLTPRRQAAVAECLWWIKNTSSIHYAQTRPMPLTAAKAHKLPLSTDCSGSVTCIYYTIGAPDPNGLNYNGQGYTGTLFSNGEEEPLSSLEPGDMIVCAQGDSTEHVYMVMSVLSGGDYELFSHGREDAPETITFSKAKQIRVGQTFHGRKFLASSAEAKPAAPTWIVVNGAGTRIGKTTKPALWAARHPGSFRKFGSVRFIRRDG